MPPVGGDGLCGIERCHIELFALDRNRLHQKLYAQYAYASIPALNPILYFVLISYTTFLTYLRNTLYLLPLKINTTGLSIAHLTSVNVECLT